MADTLTITLPDVPEKREKILRFLEEQGVTRLSAGWSEKSKWALLAETMASQAYMEGEVGEQTLQAVREFRDDFEIPDPL